MGRFINYCTKLRSKISGIFGKNRDMVIPVCIPVRHMEWEEACCTIQSLSDTAHPEKLEIRVVCQDTHGANESKLLIPGNENVRISIVQAEDWMGQMADYQKWIYLSPGCIVCQSLAELFETNLPGQAFAAALLLKNRIQYRYIQEELNLVPDMYVDTSVMLIHQPIWERYYMDIRSELASRRDAPNALQDAMNKICSGCIHILGQEWNCSWESVFADSRNEFLLYEDGSRYQKAMKRPMVMNYTGICKPWTYPIRKESGYYWRTAKNTPFFEKRIDNLSEQTGIKPEEIRNKIEAAIIECK